MIVSFGYEATILHSVETWMMDLKSGRDSGGIHREWSR